MSELYNAIETKCAAMWPNLDGLSVLGVGDTQNILDCGFVASNAPRVLNGKVCAAAPNALPFEAASVDRVLAMRDWDLHEIWRVLKPNGRLIVIAPRAAKDEFFDYKTYEAKALRKALLAAKLPPLQIAPVGGFPLLPDVWIAHSQKQVLGKMPPNRGIRLKVPSLFGRKLAPSV